MEVSLATRYITELNAITKTFVIIVKIIILYNWLNLFRSRAITPVVKSRVP